MQIIFDRNANVSSGRCFVSGDFMREREKEREREGEYKGERKRKESL